MLRKFKTENIYIFDIFTAVKFKISVFCGVVPCCFVDEYQHVKVI
jgi:hypothetical protein